MKVRVNAINIMIVAITVYLCIAGYGLVFASFTSHTAYVKAKWLSVMLGMLSIAIILARIRSMDKGWRFVCFLILLVACVHAMLAGFELYRNL